MSLKQYPRLQKRLHNAEMRKYWRDVVFAYICWPFSVMKYYEFGVSAADHKEKAKKYWREYLDNKDG